MVIKRIIFKPVKNVKLGLAAADRLKRKGFKAAQITDASGIIRGRKRGTVVLAFKGSKKVPKGFKTKREAF